MPRTKTLAASSFRDRIVDLQRIPARDLQSHDGNWRMQVWSGELPIASAAKAPRDRVRSDSTQARRGEQQVEDRQANDPAAKRHQAPEGFGTMHGRPPPTPMRNSPACLARYSRQRLFLQLARPLMFFLQLARPLMFGQAPDV